MQRDGEIPRQFGVEAGAQREPDKSHLPIFVEEREGLAKLFDGLLSEVNRTARHVGREVEAVLMGKAAVLSASVQHAPIYLCGWQ